MKIAYLSQSSIPSNAANSVQVMKMCQALARAGNQVVLYGFRGDKNDRNIYELYDVEDCFSVITWRIPFVPGSSIILAILTFIHILFDKKHDLMYSRNSFSMFFSCLSGIPFIYEVHNAPRTRIHNLLERFILSRSNFVKLVCITGSLKNHYLINHKNLDDKKVLVAPDGADVVGSEEMHNDGRLFKKSGGNARIGYAGSLHSGKGVNLILELAELLPECEFHIIGGSRRQIEEIRTGRSAANITFHGHVPHKEVIHYLTAMDILLAPYQRTVLGAAGNQDIARWMSPLKIFEYMSASKPIVCSDIPVLNEILNHENNSLLCQPDNVVQWAESVRRLVSDRDLAKRLAENAKSELMNKYSWDRRIQRILD